VNGNYPVSVFVKTTEFGSTSGPSFGGIGPAMLTGNNILPPIHDTGTVSITLNGAATPSASYTDGQNDKVSTRYAARWCSIRTGCEARPRSSTATKAE